MVGIVETMKLMNSVTAVDLHRCRPVQVRVFQQVLIGDRRGLFGHPQAEREPYAVEPLLGDELGNGVPVVAVQADGHPHVLAGAVPVDPGQLDPIPVRVDDEPATRRRNITGRPLRVRSITATALHRLQTHQARYSTPPS